MNTRMTNLITQRSAVSNAFAQSRPPTSRLQMRAESNFLPVPMHGLRKQSPRFPVAPFGCEDFPLKLSNACRYMADGGAGCPRKSPKFRLASGKACLVNSLGERCSDS